MDATTTRRRGTKTERLAEARLHNLIFQQSLEDQQGFLEAARKELPEAWHTLEQDIETKAPKEKVTLYLDRSVAAVFRKMGVGYQARINRILETWVQMKMANLEAFRRDVVERATEASDVLHGEQPGDVADQVRAHLVKHWAFEEGVKAGRGEARAGEGLAV